MVVRTDVPPFADMDVSGVGSHNNVDEESQLLALRSPLLEGGALSPLGCSSKPWRRVAELCARVDQGASHCHDVLSPFFIASSERDSSESPFATTNKPSVLPRDSDPPPQFSYRKLHQVLLESSQNVWLLHLHRKEMYSNGKSVCRVIHRRSCGRSST